MVTVRHLVDADIKEAVQLHLEVLDMEFLSRFGPSFLRTYYRAWLQSPGAISLGAVDEHEVLVGVLLGASDPALHVRVMVRRHGLRMAIRLMGHASIHPRLARDLVVTRGRRYARGTLRVLGARFSDSRGAPSAVSSSVVGEVTHVLVRPDAQGTGIGRALIDASIVAARDAGVTELVLVTPTDMTARHFYERLGWQLEDEIRSRSGEDFLRFHFKVD